MPFLTNGRSRFIGGGRVPPAPVPVAGADVIVNGDFAAGDSGWTPNTWQVVDGKAVRVSPAAADYIYRSALSSDVWYGVSIDLIAISSGYCQPFAQTTPGIPIVGPIGEKYQVIRANGAAASILGTVNSVLEIDNIAYLPLTLSSLISTRPYVSADCDISVAITRTAGTQAGISARVDSAATPANFLIAYLDGAGNVKVDKCVSGTYTNVISGAVTYGAGYILRLVCNGNNVSAYYNGTQVGSTTAVADAGIVGNKNHGLFSTYASNSFSGYVAA